MCSNPIIYAASEKQWEGKDARVLTRFVPSNTVALGGTGRAEEGWRMAARVRDGGSTSEANAWWKRSVVYQIYPRSFRDSNGDGLGDLRGIIEKLDYLKDLGVDVLWLSPVYESPNVDNGYDVSDYRAIMAEFGTMDDWREMLDGLHRREIRLLMDLVVNHTSDQHAWFKEARRSRDSRWRDYYIWRPGSNGREPNNWASCFGGSAWTLDEGTGEYYLHLFAPQQPDLNWENPRVREEIHDLMRWWLDQGVDGFRLDVINMISKVPGLPDAPVTAPGPYQWAGQYFLHGPRLREFLAEIKRDVLSQYDSFTVGEMPGATPEHAVELTHEQTGSLNMLFQFEHVGIGCDHSEGGLGKWSRSRGSLLELKQIMTRWQKELEGRGWNAFYLGNHDQPRAVSRFGDDGDLRVPSAKLLATFLLSLHGTPYVYQGDEIGMTNAPFDTIDEYRDIETLNFHRDMMAHGVHPPSEVMAAIHAKSRDNARTPMQWNAGENAGFTTGRPWIGVNSNYREVNVARETADPESILNYYRRLIRLRRANPVLVYGTYDLILESHEQVYAFTRTLQDDRVLVLLNFTSDPAVAALPSHLEPWAPEELLIGNYPDASGADIRMATLLPWEARVYRVPPASMGAPRAAGQEGGHG